MLKKIPLFGNISITKEYFVTKFHRCSLFIKTFIFGGFALRLIVFVYKLIIYEIIFITWLCNKNYFEVNC